MIGASLGLAILIVVIGGVGWWVRASRPDAQPADGGVVQHRAAEGPDRPARRISLLTEAVGYIGAILLLAGAITAIGQNWSDLSDGAQLAILSAGTFLFLVIGWLTRGSPEPSFARLSAVSWMLSVACFAGGAGVLNVMNDSAGETAFLTVATASTAYAVLLWWLGRHAIEHIVSFAGVLLSAASIINFVVYEPTSGIFGVTLWAIGVAWAAGGWIRRLEPWWAAVPLGMLTALIAPSAIGLEWALFALGIGTAAVVMAFAVYTKFTPGLAFGTIAMLAYVISAVVYYFGDSLGAPTALAITGVLVLAVAVGVARVLPYMKRKPPAQGPPMAQAPPEQRAA